MKAKIYAIILCVSMALLNGCVNYQKIVDDMNAEKEESTIEVTRISLNDINNDGKKEEVVINENCIMLLSESKSLGKFIPHNDLVYESVSALVIDIDNDDIMEVVVYAYVNLDEEIDKITSVYIIDNDDNKYYMRKMPEELANVYSYSGINAEIKPLEEYQYIISYKSEQIYIDASRIYRLSVLDVENREKLDERWEDMLKKQLVGEVVGVVNAEVVRIDKDVNCIRYYEVIKGIDRKDIGKLVVDVVFNKDGSYEVRSINFIELIDSQP